MKIVHVVDSMEVGGAETLVLQMCTVQRRHGHTPSVCAIATLGILGERMRSEGFDVRHNVGRHLSDATLNFYRIFKEIRPDAVHVHNPTPTVYAAPAARLSGVRSVVSTRHSLVAPPHDWIAEAKFAVAARFCNWIVGICDATTSNLRRLGTLPAHKLTRIYNGAATLTRTATGAWPVKSGFTFVYVGRLEPVKNHKLLLSAFHAAVSQAPDLRLWMVGDGSERINLEHMTSELKLNDYVTFWGQQADVAPFFPAADCFIMSSRSEGLPISLLQAFSVGLPAIVTDIGGMAEVVRLANAGLVVPCASATSMTAGMLQLFRDRSLRDQYSRNALQAFSEHFTVSAMTESYMNLYQGAISGRIRRAKLPRS